MQAKITAVKTSDRVITPMLPWREDSLLKP
jgi:hypothetical protein